MVHRRGVLEEVPDDNRGSALCHAESIGGEYLKEYLMTIGECFVSCKFHRRGVLEGVPDDNRGSALCRAGFIGEEFWKECFFFFSHIGIVGKECLMTPGEALCVVQGPSTGST